MRTRAHTPRTGRPKKLKLKRRKVRLGKRSPRQLAAAMAKRRRRRK